MINTKYIVLIDDDDEVWNTAVKYFQKESEYQLVKSSSDRKELKEIMLTVPDLIIINEDNLNSDSKTLVEYIRKTKEFAIIPVILVSSSEDK